MHIGSQAQIPFGHTCTNKSKFVMQKVFYSCPFVHSWQAKIRYGDHKNFFELFAYIRYMEMEVKDKLYTAEEYFALEEASEVRHEFINGQLFEMSGASTEHYLMVKRMERLLEGYFESLDYFVYREMMKVKIPGGQKYYYPDVFITREKNTVANRYAKNEPELIVEVTSESTIKTDMIDKLINYQKIPSLLYYLLVDPESLHIALFTKDSEGGWITEAFTSKEDKIALPALSATLTLSEIYQGVDKVMG